MRRAFTLVELIAVIAMLALLVTAFASSSITARNRARLSKARLEMEEIAAAVGNAADPDAAAKNYAPEGNVRDPWGQAYHVEVRRVATAKGRDLAAGGTAVYYPNAFRPVEGGAR